MGRTFFKCFLLTISLGLPTVDKLILYGIVRQFVYFVRGEGCGPPGRANVVWLLQKAT